MYQVWSHREGIKASIGTTGLVWEHDCGGHEWLIESEHRKKADAIAACDAFPFHGTVTRYHCEPVHDNGKEPGSRVADHRPSTDIQLRAPRDPAAYRLQM